MTILPLLMDKLKVSNIPSVDQCHGITHIPRSCAIDLYPCQQLSFSSLEEIKGELLSLWILRETLGFPHGLCYLIVKQKKLEQH